MSNATFSQYWTESNELYKDLVSYEKPNDLNLQVRDRSSAFQHYAMMYIKYISLYKKLEIAYDQLLHPQKRRLLKDMLVASIGRLVEVKQILVDMECSDFYNLSDILLDLKLSHDALQIPVPKFIKEENGNNEIQKILTALNAKEFTTGQSNIFLPVFNLEDAVKVIQKNERGRQGKLRARYINDLHAEAQHDKLLLLANPGDREKAAVLLQRVYRGYKAREKVKVMRHEQMVFLRMARTNILLSSNEKYERRKRLQRQFEADYLESLASTKDKLLQMEGPDIKEAIQDDFRQWYMESKRIHGKFPDFPSEEVWKDPNFKFKTTTDPQLEAKILAKDGKSASSKPNTPKPATPKPVTPKGGKKEVDNDQLEKFQSLGDSEFLKMSLTQVQKYESAWKGRDESDNFAQRHDQNIIKAAKRLEVEAQIKQEVFVILEEELKNLKLAVEKDGKKKGKAAKAKKPKKEKKAGKKGKKDKDLTADRTMESLIEELVQTGIMQKYSDWNYNLTESLVTKDVFISPSTADIQRTLVEYCALPLGITFTEDAPKPKYEKISSILLYGSSGTGKSRLIQSLASELGATLFNLSPKNTDGQFQGKQNVTKMIHMVFKVAKANYPAIIYIEGIEMIFAKKIPKDDTSDPKRIKKDFAKALKLIRDPSCRVIVIGVSKKPWEGDAKAMLPLFDKFLYCPKPDYASRYMVVKTMVERKTLDLSRNLNYSLLTKMSDNLSTGMIEMVVDRVLTEKRLQQPRALENDEFLKFFSDLPPDSRGLEEIQLFKDFSEKVASKRAALLNGPSDEELSKAKKK